MSKKVTALGTLSLEEVHKRVQKSKTVLEHKRWRVIELSLKGEDNQAISEKVSYSYGWVLKMIDRYNKQGESFINDERGSSGGHNALLTDEQKLELIKALKEETPLTGGLWTGPKVALWIKQKTGKETYPQRGWVYLTKRLGFSAKVPRPHHTKANEEDQKKFKKNLNKK